MSKLREDVPHALDAVIAKAIAKVASHRFANALEFAAALRTTLQHLEADVAAQMAASIREDFMGELPRALSLKTLDELEEAWQRAKHQSGIPASSYPPPQISLGKLSMLASMPPTVSLGLARTGTAAAAPQPEPPPTQPAAAKGVAAPPAPAAVPAPQGMAQTRWVSPRWVLITAAGALLLTGVSVTALAWLRSSAAPKEARFVVVESRAEQTLAQPMSTEPGSVPAASAAATPSGSPSASIKSTRVAAGQRDSSNNLSRTFSKRQAAIQSCFQRDATNVTGAPELSIRFSTDARGKVTSASVRPPAVAAAALGQCLESVARSTDFGPQEGPLTFSIPITARVR